MASGPLFPLQGPISSDVPTQARNPTLVPNFGIAVANNGVVSNESPARFLVDNPRTDATVIATIGGSATNTNTVTLTVKNGVLASSYFGATTSGQVSWTYTVGASDSLTNIAEGLAVLISDDPVSQLLGLRADAAGAVLTLHHSGPVGNFSTVSRTLSGGATETVTFTPSGGAFGSGDGPIIPVSNFDWCTGGGQILNFWYGRPVFVGYSELALMVSQGMPIV